MTNLTTLECSAQEPAQLDYCDPKITSAVDEAYEAVWAVLQNTDANGEKTECERRMELSQRLAELVLEGITDPNELRNRALANPVPQTLGQADDAA